MHKILSLLFFCSLFLSSCQLKRQVASIKTIDPEVLKLKDWKKDRIKNLTSTFGWLSVNGLVWLKKERLTVGTDHEDDVTIPFAVSKNFGTLQKEEDAWVFHPAQNAELMVENKPLTSKIKLQHDQTGQATILNHKSLFWHLIKRGENYGIRIKDTLNQARFNLKSIPAFGYDSKFVIEAKVKRAAVSDSILITNVQGVTLPTKLMGWLTFMQGGKSHSIAFIDGGGDTWFAVYGDETNNVETYGGGRFLYVQVPATAQTVNIDFNRSQNPPCYFTDFATCPLPPKENVLSTRITAGERSDH